MKIILLISVLFLSGCAAMHIDDKATVKSKTQCPIGYHLEQTGGVVIFAGSKDKNKHTVEFRCVADSVKDSYKNSDVIQ